MIDDKIIFIKSVLLIFIYTLATLENFVIFI